jgi:hypothetical protein
MSFALYLLGTMLVIGGVAWGMAALHIATTAIVITCLILLGIGVLSAVKNERERDKS